MFFLLEMSANDIYIWTHLDKNKYEYFKNIKMNLYHKKYKIKSTNGKETDIELIIYKI